MFTVNATEALDKLSFLVNHGVPKRDILNLSFNDTIFESSVYARYPEHVKYLYRIILMYKDCAPPFDSDPYRCGFPQEEHGFDHFMSVFMDVFFYSLVFALLILIFFFSILKCMHIGSYHSELR